ncbi:carnosine synthase 1-like isoform X2 [Alosa pseudoharengus]|uniref:carnosine synthase 1-like isoform X2 n=1 Tax=Alosa pseudoharengus TaxID=34774 RepID=UPI003F8B8E45
MDSSKKDKSFLPQSYSTLQQILCELALPKTRDRTQNPTKDVGRCDVIICVMASPDKYLSLLLAGGKKCPGRMMLCLCPSWVCRSPSNTQSGLFSLFILKAVTFEAGGYTYLDTFSSPCRVMYLLEDGSMGPSVGEGLDCLTCSSPQLNTLTEDVLLNYQLLGGKGVPLPPMLALSYRPPEGLVSSHPSLMLHPTQEKEDLQESMEKVISDFLQQPEVQGSDKVLVQLSTSGWGSQESAAVLRRQDREGLLRAAAALVPQMREGEAILLTACYPSIQPLQRTKVKNSPFKEPTVRKEQLFLHISAQVCRTPDDQPQVTQMLCWVDRAETHPRAGPSILQSLEETLRDWGLSQLDDIISSLEKWAKTALQAIMDHQSELEVTKKGGLHARTDLIGVDFSLGKMDGELLPFLLGIKNVSRGMFSTPNGLLHPQLSSSAIEPLLQTICHHSHCSILAGKTLLFIGAGASKKLRVFVTAKQYGIKSILVCYKEQHPAYDYVSEYLVYDYKDHTQDEVHTENIVSLLEKKGLQPDGCLTFICKNTILCALVRAKLGLPGDTVEAISIAKRKSHTQRHLAAVDQGWCHLPAPRQYTVRSENFEDLTDLTRTAESFGFPAVVKQEYGAGSVSVKLVENAQQCEEYVQEMTALKTLDPNGGFASNPMIMEFLEGVKYVVDLAIFEGRLLLAFVSCCGPSVLPYFISSSHLMPSGVSQEKEAQIVAAAYQSCLHCGLENGVYNVDLKLTDHGPKLIEINPRAGGNFLPTWIKEVYGVDIFTVAFLIACNIQPQVWTPQPRGYYVGISCPIKQHFRAKEKTPEFDVILNSLNNKGLVKSSMITDVKDYTAPVATLNLSSFSKKREDAINNILLASQMLCVDSEDYPVRYFLEPFM